MKGLFNPLGEEDLKKSKIATSFSLFFEKNMERPERNKEDLKLLKLCLFKKHMFPDARIVLIKFKLMRDFTGIFFNDVEKSRICCAL